MGAKGSSRGSAVFGVTSEALASVSFQGAPARSGRPDSDHSAGNDSFAALIDSNTAASNNDNRPQDIAPRRADDSQAPSDNRARDNTAAPDKAATDKAPRNDSSDPDAAVNARDTGDADTKSDASGRTKSKPASSKSAASKSDETKSDETKESKPPSGDSAAAADQTGATADVTANAIASVIPVTTATTETTAANPV